MKSAALGLCATTVVVLSLLHAVDCAAQDRAVADRIFVGGTIVTMDASQPAAEAVAIAGERILAVGGRDEVLVLRGPATQVVDLGGRALLPGFIDAHGHISGVASSLAMVDLTPPPVGDVTNIADIQDKLRRALAERTVAPDAWLVGRGYDDSLLAEARHPTRDDLDAASTETPIALVHVSGHLTTCNSRALELAEITAERDDPSGGVIQRRARSREPNGVLEEKAANLVKPFFPSHTAEELLELLDHAQDIYASYGVTTAQDGATGAAQMELLLTAAKQRRLRLDVVSYAAAATLDDMPSLDVGAPYAAGLKVAGVKLFLDGSPQGKTAYLSRPYHVPPTSKPADYRGYPTIDDQRLNELVDMFYGRGVQIIAHANGDAACEQLIAAVERAVQTHGSRDHRSVMIHAQTVRLDQLDRMRDLAMIPSFFVAHTFFWGDWHRDSVLGPQRAALISPARSAADRGLRFTFHNDSPVTPPDMLRLVWTGVNRLTRSRQVIGAAERVDVERALAAVTIDAARQHFDEADKGSITVGKLADLVILSADPRAIDPAAIKELKVIETIRRGKTIYRAP